MSLMMMRIGAAVALVAAGLLALAVAYEFGGGAEAGILAATIGTLVLAAFALPRGEPAHAAAQRLAGGSAVAWAVSAMLYTCASFLFITNRAVSGGFDQAFASFLTEVDAGRAGLGTAALAAVVALSCFFLHGPPAAAATVLLAFGGLVPLVLRSHATGGAGHADSTTALIVHTATAAVWLGGLMALVLLRAKLPDGRFSATVRRYSTLALICFICLAVSGFLAGLARISSVEAVLSPYGVLLLAKTAAFIILGCFGVLHRRWSLRRLERDPHRGGRHFALLAVAELAVMGAASGTAAALARTEPPASGGARSPLLLGPDVWAYLTQWAPDPLWALACGFAGFFYLAGVRRLRAAGRTWPVRRTILWLGGITVLFWVTNGGPHVYQGSLFSAHVLTQMMLTAVIPLLLVPAAPVALAKRAIHARTDGSTGIREILTQTVPTWPNPAKDPYLAVLLLGGSLLVIYYRPFLDWSGTVQLGYSAMTLLALLAGCLFAHAMSGASARQASVVAQLAVVAATAALYAVYAWRFSTQEFDPGRAGDVPSALDASASGQASSIIWSLAAVTLGCVATSIVARRRPARKRVPETLSAVAPTR
jgi:cytochrome c oxidase assembly factor CtaG/putative copper export protein